MSSKKAIAYAEKMASKHLENTGLSKAFGTMQHADLVTAYLPFGEAAADLAKNTKKLRRQGKNLEVQQQLMTKMLERGEISMDRERVFLESVEAHHASLSGKHPMVRMDYPVPSTNGHH